MSKTEIIEHHGFGFGISQLLNQTDRFSPLIKNEGTNIQVNTFSSEENSDKIWHCKKYDEGSHIQVQKTLIISFCYTNTILL